MTLVERFIKINAWPTSRKSVLLCSLGLCAALPIWLMIRFSDSVGFEYLDRELLDTVMGAWTIAHLLVLSLSLVAMRRGGSGEWTAVLFVMFMGPPLVAMVYLAGTFTSPFFALYPLATILLALWFGERVGWLAFIMGVLSFTTVGFLEARGVLPHAPMIRNLEAAAAPLRAVGRMMPVMAFFVYCFGLSVLIVAARKLQDSRLRETQALIRRYVPSQLAEKIASGGHADIAKTERRNLTLFFSDVEGFTNASDELDPEHLAVLLNEYLSEMATIADRHAATINQFVGDGIMIFFGAPTATNDKDHALRAVRMSLEMQQRMGELQQIWFKRGFQRPFRIRIGINTGYASVGDFGSRGRVVYSAIGLQTNLAARIQAQCEPGKVLISHSTWALVHEEIPCEPKGELQVKGIHYPIKVYEIAGQ